MGLNAQVENHWLKPFLLNAHIKSDDPFFTIFEIKPTFLKKKSIN